MTSNNSISIVRRSAVVCFFIMMMSAYVSAQVTTCVGSTVTFTDRSAGTTSNTTYSWNFGSGATPATANTIGPHVITYNTSGLKTVSLTITDGASDTETKINYVTVKDFPSIAGNISGAATVCEGQALVSYTVPAIANAITYSWAYSGIGATIHQGTTNSILISFAPNATSGNLTVMGVNSCGTGTVSPAYAVTVNIHPNANYTFSNNPIVAEPVQFVDVSQTNGGGAINAWQWNFGEPGSGVNNTSTIQHPIHTYNTLGAHRVTLVAQNTLGCLDTIVKTVVVSLPPFAAPITTVGIKGAGAGYPVFVPITVTNFDSVTKFSLRLEYNPNVMTFSGAVNKEPALFGMQVTDSYISPILHKVMITWLGDAALTLPDFTKLTDLAFTFISGTTAVAFNTLSSGGLDCEYTDVNGNPMIDVPALVYYINGEVHEGLDITGAFTYNNSANTPLDSLWVILNENGVKVDSTRTNISGQYAFYNKPSHTYTIGVNCHKPFDMPNSTDALKIQLHFSGLEILTVPVRLQAADVNNTININAADAIKVKRRYVGLDTSFARGNWTFAKPTGGDTVIVAGTDLVQDFQGLCVGDVEASYNPPPGQMASRGVSLLTEGAIEVMQGSEFELPVRIAMNAQIGAISLAFGYPREAMQLINISMGNGSVLYYDNNGQIRIAWSQIDPLNLSNGDVMLTLKFKLSDAAPVGIPISLNIGMESELADGWGIPVANSALSIPSVLPVKPNGILENSELITNIMIYPNPSVNKVWIDIELSTNANILVECYNMVGGLISKISFDGLAKGRTKREMDISGFAAGVYTVKTTVKGQTTSTSLNKLVKAQQ